MPRYRCILSCLCVALTISICTTAFCGEDDDRPRPPGGLDKPVSLVVREATLRDVLTQIRAAAGVDFVADDEALDDLTITIQVKDKPVIGVLQAIALTHWLRLEVVEGGIVVLTWREEDMDDEEEDEEDEDDEPPIPEKVARKAIKNHPHVKKLQKHFGELRFELEWNPEWGVWHGEILAGDQEIGAAAVNGEGEVVKIHVEGGKHGKKDDFRKPEAAEENF